MKLQKKIVNEKCRICSSSRICIVIKFKPTPPGDLFLPNKSIHLSSKKYPLNLALCEDCGYLHLPYILEPHISYSNYIYETKVTVGLNQHYKKFAKDIISIFNISKFSFVVDLGSNDGTMLKAFKECKMKVLGVEPNEQIAKNANKNNLETINDYFNSKVANIIKKNYGEASIVTANYMYANIDNIYEFTENVKKILDDRGLFVIQTGYHPEQMKINMFDYIYHEHFSYFSIKVLKDIFERSGLELIHIKKLSTKGGSIRAIAQHKGGKLPIDHSVKLFINEEQNAGIHDKKIYIKFAREILLQKKKILEYVRQIKSEGHTIVGYGASHSTTTLLHHFELGKYLEFIIDDNPIKHGLYSPGYHLPVYPVKKLYEKFPRYIIILAWQHKDTIINRNKKYLKKGGSFLVPLPELVII